MNTLIITSKEDAHADYLIEKINTLGFGDKTIRFNTEDLIENTIYTFSENNISIFLKDSNRTINTNELTSVWYRRPKTIKYKHPYDDGITKFVNDQTNTFLNGIYCSTEKKAYWINPLSKLASARSKILQLDLAHELNIKTPKTIITNNPSIALDFAKLNDVINKSLTVPYFELNDTFYPYLTTKFTYSEIEKNKKTISLCPTLFQEFIEKKFDVRVIYLEGKIYSFAIYSQENQHTLTDFRGASPHLLRHEIINLDKALEKKIKLFIKKQGLVFSALDFVVDKNDEFYFLENNPNGQWVWLELVTKTTILSDRIIELLYK